MGTGKPSDSQPGYHSGTSFLHPVSFELIPRRVLSRCFVWLSRCLSESTSECGASVRVREREPPGSHSNLKSSRPRLAQESNIRELGAHGVLVAQHQVCNRWHGEGNEAFGRGRQQPARRRRLLPIYGPVLLWFTFGSPSLRQPPHDRVDAAGPCSLLPRANRQHSLLCIS